MSAQFITSCIINELCWAAILTRVCTPYVKDDSPPTYIDRLSAGNDIKLKSDTPAAPALCVWPPNVKFYCLLDIFSQSGGSFIQTSILPIRDNCAAVATFGMTINALRTTGTAAPSGTGTSGTGFGCTDSDPRSQRGAPIFGDFHSILP